MIMCLIARSEQLTWRPSVAGIPSASGQKVLLCPLAIEGQCPGFLGSAGVTGQGWIWKATAYATIYDTKKSDARLLISITFPASTHRRPFITLDTKDAEGLVVSLLQVLAVSGRDYSYPLTCMFHSL